MKEISQLTRRGFVAGAAALAAGSIFALAGCGGNSDSSSTTSSSSDGTAKSTSASSESGESDSGTKTNLRFVTGGESGTYYAFGSVIAQHATNNTNLNITAASSGGSQANVQELQDGTADLGFCQSDVMTYAYEGTNLFEGEPITDVFSVLGALYQEQVQIVTCDSSITSIADLKGKSVSIGAAGSGVYFNAIDILGAYGITEDDITPTYQSFGDSADSLRDGQIDAAFITAGAPTTAIVDLSTSKDAYLIPIDDDHISQLLESSPYYSEATIAAGTYNGQDEDVKTVGVDAVIIVRDSISEDDVYTLTKDIFSNAADLVENHAKYAEVNDEKGASITTVPYHPGAAKYFKEKGFEVPTKE
jgi:TRAP transporter TAXI family solute receptor